MRDATIQAIGMVLAAATLVGGTAMYLEYNKYQVEKAAHEAMVTLQQQTATQRAEEQKAVDEANERLAAQQAAQDRKNAETQADAQQVSEHKEEARRQCRYWQTQTDSNAKQINLNYWCNQQ